jgi:hypothetical protein
VAAIDENFRAVLLDYVIAPTPVEQNTVAEGTPLALRLWYQRRQLDAEPFLDGSAGLAEVSFDVEIMSGNIAEVEELVDTIRAAAADGGLNGYRGVFGAGRTLGVFVEDQSDDYELRGVNSDEGWHVAALSVRVIS